MWRVVVLYQKEQSMNDDDNQKETVFSPLEKEEDATMKPHDDNKENSRILWWEHNPTIKTFVATLSVSFGSAIVTYPAQLMKLEWQQTALSQWTSSSSNNKIELNPKRWNVQATIKPLLRLVLNEVALTSLSGGGILPKFSDEVLAGTMAGFSQALIVCPFEAYSANHQMKCETKRMLEEQKKKWWLPHPMVVEPRERLIRAYKGVGGMAIREILFNATFFPMYHWFLQTQQYHPIPSAIISGSICAQFVTPLDVWATYMMHSRTTWHWWSGRKLHAPPLPLLFRGITLQALIFGPSFGLVAAVYQLT